MKYDRIFYFWLSRWPNWTTAATTTVAVILPCRTVTAIIIVKQRDERVGHSMSGLWNCSSEAVIAKPSETVAAPDEGSASLQHSISVSSAWFVNLDYSIPQSKCQAALNNTISNPNYYVSWSVWLVIGHFVCNCLGTSQQSVICRVEWLPTFCSSACSWRTEHDW